MRRRRDVLVAAALVWLVACDSPVGTTASIAAADAPVAASESGIVAAVHGSGHLGPAETGERRSIRAFTISARNLAGGDVKGQYHLTTDSPFGPDAHPLLKLHGTITCLIVDGDRAYLGGTVDRRNFFEGVDITGVAIEVVDNGSGPSAPPDEISNVGLFVANPDGPQDYCDAATPGPVIPVDHGDISVR